MQKDQDYFLENLSMLLTSGLGVSGALESLKKEVKSPAVKKDVDKIIEEIRVGSPIWKALQDARFVSPHAISLIKLGEESGRLAQNLRVVVEEEQKNRVLKSKIRSALLYPGLVLSLTVVIGIGIAWFVLPRLATVFAQLKLQLPLLTKILIGIGTFLGQYGYIAIPLFLLLLGVAIYLMFFFKETKYIGERLIFTTPGISRLVKEVEISRFGYMLGTLLESGLAINNSLDSLAEVTPLKPYKDFYGYLKNSIEEGNSFQKSFAAYPRVDRLLPPAIQHMVVAGEASGNLSKTLLDIGEIYEGKTDATTKNLTVLLEPVLLFIVWLGVVAVALAIVLPIYSLVGGINQ